MKPILVTALAAGMLTVAMSASALTVDEATYPGAGGDYNNLLSPPQAVATIFDLSGGTNTFKGRIGTPGDPSDTILVQLDPTATLTRISVMFATNADDFNPVAINQGTRLVFDYASSNTPTPLVDLAITGRPSGPTLFQTGLLSLTGGLFNTTLLSEVLALNNSGLVGYAITFDVTAPVPEPSTYALMLGGLALLGAAARRARC